MLVLNRLDNLDYIRAKQSALIIARRTATPAEQMTEKNHKPTKKDFEKI